MKTPAGNRPDRRRKRVRMTTIRPLLRRKVVVLIIKIKVKIIIGRR